MASTYKLSTQKAKAGESPQVQDQPELQHETLKKEEGKKIVTSTVFCLQTVCDISQLTGTYGQKSACSSLHKKGPLKYNKNLQINFHWVTQGLC